MISLISRHWNVQYFLTEDRFSSEMFGVQIARLLLRFDLGYAHVQRMYLIALQVMVQRMLKFVVALFQLVHIRIILMDKRVVHVSILNFDITVHIMLIEYLLTKIAVFKVRVYF